MRLKPESEPETPNAGRGSLKARLLLILAIALTPILLLGIFQAILEARSSLDQRRERLLRDADRAIVSIEQALETAESLVEAFEPEIRRGRCGRVLQRVQPLIPAISNVTAFDTEAVTVCSALGPTGGLMINPEWNERLKSGDQVVRTNAFYGPLSEAYIFAILTRSVNEAGEYQGAVSFAMRVDALLASIRSTDLPASTSVAIADGEGSVFGSDLFIQINPKWITSIRAGQGARFFVDRQPNRRNYDVVVRAVGPEGVYLVIYQPSPGLLSELTLKPLTLVGVPLLSFALTLLVAWLALDSLVLRWFGKLRRMAAAYAAGLYDFRSDREFDKAPVELARLANTLNRMAGRIGERDSSLKSALAMRDDAVKEIHHRVKNNLQIVTSFLNLQSRQVSDPEAKAVLAAARHRIDALSIVHQTLYQNDQLDEVSVRPFVQGLMRHLSGALGIEDGDIDLSVEVDDFELPADTGIPLALFLVEATTNAMKYAFDDEGGLISVRVTEKKGTVTVEVGDDGHGADVSEQGSSGSGLGSKLMSAFAKQMKGELQVETTPGKGFTTRIVFEM